jgi:hypothetical protein
MIAGIGFRPGWRQEQVDRHLGEAARLGQEEAPEPVVRAVQMPHLVGHGPAGNGDHTTGDHAPDLALRVGSDDRQRPGPAHRPAGSGQLVEDGQQDDGSDCDHGAEADRQVAFEARHVPLQLDADGSDPGLDLEEPPVSGSLAPRAGRIEVARGDDRASHRPGLFLTEARRGQLPDQLVVFKVKDRHIVSMTLNTS